MTKKITLYSDEELIREIKALAKNKSTSVSQIVNDFFKTLLIEEQISKNSKATITNKLFGALKDIDMDEPDYKEFLEKKYL